MNRRQFIGGLISSAVVAPWPGSADAAEASACEDLNSLLRPILEESGFPALAAGAIKKGSVLGAGAVGLRMAGGSTAVTVDDKFHLGSCTKAMTSTLAGMLVEERKIKWGTTIAQVFPERRQALDEAFRETTIAMLLTHRSGLPHDGSTYGKSGAPVTEQRLAYLDAVLAKPPPNKPGTFNYSNAGYIVAGAMLERVTGKIWEELMRERLFKPLGMGSAGFGVPMTGRQADQPWGHESRGDKFVPRYGDNHRALGPAGTVHCAIKDYLKFAALHSSLGSRPRGIISKGTCEKLHTAPADDYAFGWAVCERNWARGQALTHAGSNNLNYFVVWVAPKTDFALAAACNCAGDKASAVLDKIAGRLVEKYG